EGPRVRLTNPVILAARRTRARPDHGAVDHAVAVIVLETVFLVLVIARRQFELMDCFTKHEARAEHRLDTPCLVLAVVVAYPERIVSTGATRQDRVGGGISRRIVKHFGEGAVIAVRGDIAGGENAHIVELVPGAF